MAGGQYEPTNQIIDDKTYYGDEYDAAYDKIREELEKDNEILEEQKIVKIMRMCTPYGE
jgi:hypothetical protein